MKIARLLAVLAMIAASACSREGAGTSDAALGSARVAVVNGEPGLHVYVEGRLTAAMAIDLDGGRIAAVYAVVNPEKLAVTDPPVSPSLK